MVAVEPPTRGLQSIQEGRKRRAGFPKIPPRFWLWSLLILAVWAIIYWKVTQGQLESWRNRILARQRAVAAELGPRYRPLQETLEHWVQESSGPYAGDFTSPQLSDSDFRSKPGVYLRLPIEKARDPKELRQAATESLRDGFTACLIRANNPDPLAGPACKVSHECPQGQHCNETFHCSVPAQPYNLRIAYRATRILEEDWMRDVREANSDMRLRLFERDFDSAVQDDLPLVIDLMTRAQYFLLVIDEPADQPVSIPDGGTYAEALQTMAHPARVYLFDLPHKTPLLRLRSSAAAEVGTAAADPKIQQAVRRQANNCALALEVRRALGDKDAP